MDPPMVSAVWARLESRGVALVYVLRRWSPEMTGMEPSGAPGSAILGHWETGASSSYARSSISTGPTSIFSGTQYAAGSSEFYRAMCVWCLGAPSQRSLRDSPVLLGNCRRRNPEFFTLAVLRAAAKKKTAPANFPFLAVDLPVLSCSSTHVLLFRGLLCHGFVPCQGPASSEPTKWSNCDKDSTISCHWCIAAASSTQQSQIMLGSYSPTTS